jgi:hypothetical protein
MAALLAVTGCGSGTAERRHPEPAAIAPPSMTGSPVVTRNVQAVARTQTVVKNVPAAFRLPPGSQVTDLSDHESGASFTLSAPDPQTVLAFYRRQLPFGAFTILADRSELNATSLAFRNEDGWAGTIHATAYRVTVAVKHA